MTPAVSCLRDAFLSAVLVTLTLLAVLACGGSRSEGPDEVNDLSDVPQQLRQLDLPLRLSVETEAWAHPTDRLSAQLLESVVQAQRAYRQSPTNAKIEAVAQLLDSAKAQPWYTDGLSEAESLTLADLFSVYSEGLYHPASPDLGVLLKETITYGTFGSYGTGSEEAINTFVGGADSEDGKAIISLLDDFISALRIELGLPRANAIAVLIHENYPMCAASLRPVSLERAVGLIVMAPNCATQAVLAHELVHLFMSGPFPTWFKEGAAIILGNAISGFQGNAVERSTRFLTERGVEDPVIDLEGVYGTTQDEFFIQAAAGVVFLGRARELLPLTALFAVARELKAGASGREIVDAMLREAVRRGATGFDVLIAQMVRP